MEIKISAEKHPIEKTGLKQRLPSSPFSQYYLPNIVVVVPSG